MTTPAPGCSLIIIGNCPHLERVVCPGRLCCSLRVVSFSCHKDVIDHSCPVAKVAAGQNGSEQSTAGTKWRQRYQAFLLFQVNSWVQVRSP
jgi:hypothetical protein